MANTGTEQAGQIDLGFCLNLRKLRIPLAYYPREAGFISRTAYTVETIPAINDLREITFITVCSWALPNSGDLFTDDLESIDNILMRSQFSGLRKVVFIFFRGSESHPNLPEFLAKCRLALPALDAAGILSFE